MLRFLLTAAALPLAVAAAVAAPAPVNRPAAADLPVPAKAMLVAQLNGVGKARERLEKMIQAAAPDLAPVAVQAFNDALSKALDGRDVSALTPDARVFVVINSFEAGPDGPPVVALLPLTDYKLFRQKLLTDDERKSFTKGSNGVDSFDATGDKPAYAADLTARGYVAVGNSEEAVKALAGKYERLTPAAMGPAVADAFLTADVALFVNMERVNEDYGDKIKQFRQLFQALVQQGLAMGGTLDKKQVEMIKEVYDGMFQAAEDARGFTYGFAFRPEGLNLRMAAGFASDTATTKMLGAERPASVAGVGEVPAGMTSYVAGRISQRMANLLASFGGEFAPEDEDDKSAAVFKKYAELAANSGGFVAGGTPPSTSFGVTTPADAKAVVEAKLKAVKALTAGAKFQNVPLKEKPVVKEAAHKAAGYTLHEVRLVLDFDAAVRHIPDANLRDTTLASMKRMVSERMTLWFGTDGKKVVQVAAKDWPAAEKLLTDYAAGKNLVGGNAAFTLTRGQLPADATVVTLIDLGRMVGVLGETFGDMAGTVPGLPIGKLPTLGAAPAAPVYLGGAITLNATDARLDVFVPAAGVGVVREMLKPVLEKKAD